ncbi:hypothetical protein EV702DRAFT_1213924 [Suillus placidus]|uniref:Translation initiation factor IF- 2 domain-containing protein n=1 Tax=Suillus placidus TaxID=48579 RepID=A0A9P6ZID2_9AGAM|nr:hypothetical protein EV702DRAFT_1213924 [Suillus placidus]
MSDLRNNISGMARLTSAGEYSEKLTDYTTGKKHPTAPSRNHLRSNKDLGNENSSIVYKKTIIAFVEQGLNAVLDYENKSFARNGSPFPPCAITGEGVFDTIMLLVNLTQQRMIVCGLNGPIVTQVRALLTPQPLRELRIKASSAYVHHKEVKAALGVKLVAPDLDKAVAGSQLLVVGPDNDEEALLDEVMSDLTSLLDSLDKSGRGVCVQASTCKIPVSGINIGPVHKTDVMRAATMLEKAKELAVILCFDVPVDKDSEKLAEEMGIKSIQRFQFPLLLR